MINRNFLEGMYEDFFGIEKLAKENEKLAEELGLNRDLPKIEIPFQTVKNKSEEEKVVDPEMLKAQRDKKMANLFDKIDSLYISEESKNTLKKIIEYMRKYSEKIEKQFISFNMCIYSDSKETIYKVRDIIKEAALYFRYIKNGYSVENSFYNIEEPTKLDDIYGEQNAVILFKDFEGFISKEQNFKDRFLHNLLEEISRDKHLTIFAAKNKEMVKQSFEKNEDIMENVIDFEIISVKPDVQDIYQEILDKLKVSSEITEEAEVKLLDYVSVTFPNSGVSYNEYRDKICEKILFSKDEKIEEKDIPVYEKPKTTEEVFAELNELVGLEKVKQVLQDLVSLIELKNKTQDNLKIKDTNLHMVFLGNPGTGKTTVARIIAQILYNLKYVEQNKLIEVSSKDLVAEYVGQTGPKTMSVVEKAMGGVLFIDEAYSLASGNGQGNSFNEEAIATLIQAMENYRDNLVVIFAGYTKEMQAFLDSNSGIVSRIGYTMEFEDYTEDQLIQIFKNMMKKSGFSIEPDAIEEVRKIIREYKNSKNFGNARFVRNIYEKSIIKHATNTKGKKQKKILCTITKKDISAENLLK